MGSIIKNLYNSYQERRRDRPDDARQPNPWGHGAKSYKWAAIWKMRKVFGAMACADKPFPHGEAKGFFT